MVVEILVITGGFVILITFSKSLCMLLKRYLSVREEKKVNAMCEKIAARKKVF